MSDLTDFLLARLAEDEAVARAHEGDPNWRTERREPIGPSTVARWQVVSVQDDWEAPGYPAERIVEAMIGGGNEEERPTVDHIARHDPTRVLADVKAKRAIVEDRMHLDTLRPGPVRAHSEWACRVLATVYADHPDYDATWAP